MSLGPKSKIIMVGNPSVIFTATLWEDEDSAESREPPGAETRHASGYTPCPITAFLGLLMSHGLPGDVILSHLGPFAHGSSQEGS